jgi:hypothetical protein
MFESLWVSFLEAYFGKGVFKVLIYTLYFIASI